MKYPKIITTILVSTICSLSAQEGTSDQLFLSNGEIYEVTVKKVEPETITYNYKGEDLENVVKKSDVAKVIFKNGREQAFSSNQDSQVAVIPSNFEYPTMKENQGAILPFEFILDGAANTEEGMEAQEYYYDILMHRPERNTITYQDAETTQKRLRAAGIKDAFDMRDYEMSEIAKIIGAGILVTGKITVDYRSTNSNSSGSTTTKVDTKKKKVKSYSSDYSSSRDEFNTHVVFRMYNKDGEKIIDENRTPFLASTRNSYVSSLNYYMKRTPYYQK